MFSSYVSGCNGQLHTVNVTFGYFDHNHNTGYIKSPGYPASYGNNEKCNWTIVVQTGFQINVRIVNLEFASSGDFFAIDDGKTTQTSRDHKLPWSFKSRDRMLRVSFMSNSRSRRKRAIAPLGFYMKYERGKVGECSRRNAFVYCCYLDISLLCFYHKMYT